MSNKLQRGRRSLLRGALFGTGALGLRSLATGIPAALLADPTRAFAQSDASSLVLLSSSNADPIGANVPGTYKEGMAHPGDPRMAATQMSLGGQDYTAAKPWAELPASIRDRMAFIHHTTLTNAHPNHGKVMRLMGAMRGDEMAISSYAANLGPRMDSVQTEPLSLGATGRELVSFQGRLLANVKPRALKTVLAGTGSPLNDLREMRDREMGRIHAILKERGTSNQKRMIDRFAKTRAEARSLSDTLLDRLSIIDDDGGYGQALAAPILLAMNVSPVITLKFNFGRDNHTDANLQKEADETVEGVSHIQTLVEGLDAMSSQIGRDVLVASLNVFGRTLSKKGTNGRDHNTHRHCTILIGNKIKPGVIGDLMPKGNDWSAMAIDSGTGQGREGADIAHEETLAAVGKTIGAALGVPTDYLDQNIQRGKVIRAAFKDPQSMGLTGP